MARQKHLRAFNRMVNARGLEQVAAVAPIVELGRDLARDLDAHGFRVRQVATYQSVLRELERHARSAPAPAPKDVTESGAIEPSMAPVTALEAFVAKRQSGGG